MSRQPYDAPVKTKNPSPYVQHGREGLLTDILGETAQEAAVEEQLLSRELERKVEALEAQRVTEENRRREAARRSLDAEQQRLRDRALRRAQLLEAHSPRSTSEVAVAVPNTDEFASISATELDTYVQRNEMDVADLNPINKGPRLVLWAVAAGTGLLTLSVVLLLLTSTGSTIDQTTYEQTVVAVSTPMSTSANVDMMLVPIAKVSFTPAVAVNDVVPPEESDSGEASRRSRNERDRDRDRDRDDESRSSSNDASSNLGISLDGGSDIFASGSE